MEAAFYGNDDRRLSPRERRLTLIEGDVGAMLEVGNVVVDGMRAH